MTRSTPIRLGVEMLEDRCTPATFSNMTPFIIRDLNTASLHPSPITVSGLEGTISKVTVTLHNFHHGYPYDVDILLVDPAFRNAIVLSDTGGSGVVNNLTITLDDAAAQLPPTPLTSGTFKPDNATGGTADNFFLPAPLPFPSGNSQLATFTGGNPNGTWELYVVDDSATESGVMGGWSLDIQTEFRTAINVTGMTNVTPGRLRLNGTRARQSLTITNNGGASYAGLVSLLLTGLKRKVKLVGQSGTTAVFSPGNPFVSLTLGGDGDLDPGESITFNLVFKNPTGRKFRFTPLVVAGLGTL